MGKRTQALKAFCTNIHELIEMANSLKTLGNPKLIEFLKTPSGKSVLARLQSYKIGLRFIPNTYMMTSFIEEINKTAPGTEKTVRKLIEERNDTYFCNSPYIVSLTDDKDLKRHIPVILSLSSDEERNAIYDFMVAFVEQSDMYLEGLKKGH